MTEEPIGVRPSRVTPLLRYAEARERYEQLNEEAKRAREEMEVAEYELVEDLLESGETKRGDDRGRTFRLRAACHFSLTEANVENMAEWLRARGVDPASMQKLEFRRSQVKEYLQEVVAKEGIEVCPPFLKVDTHPEITVDGWKRAKEAT